jgi:hypothetical protein
LPRVGRFVEGHFKDMISSIPNSVFKMRRKVRVRQKTTLQNALCISLTCPMIAYSQEPHLLRTQDNHSRKRPMKLPLGLCNRQLRGLYSCLAGGHRSRPDGVRLTSVCERFTCRNHPLLQLRSLRRSSSPASSWDFEQRARLRL